jgi:hypothetical protein
MADKRNAADFGMTLIIVSALGGLGVLCLQMYSWLRWSNWVNIDFVMVLKRLHVAWAASPHELLGLHQFLQAVPLVVALPAAGAMIGSLIVAIASE